MSVCLSVCLSFYLIICLTILLSVCLISLYLYIASINLTVLQTVYMSACLLIRTATLSVRTDGKRLYVFPKFAKIGSRVCLGRVCTSLAVVIFLILTAYFKVDYAQLWRLKTQPKRFHRAINAAGTSCRIRIPRIAYTSFHNPLSPVAISLFALTAHQNVS